MSNQGAVVKLENKAKKTVKDLLAELNKDVNYVVLVNGKRAGLQQEVFEGDKIIVLPKIAGG